LIDADSAEEFDEKLYKLVDVWNTRELQLRQLKSSNATKFAEYFVTRISDDMKRKMIRSVRKELTNLGDNFFLNNASESINERLKLRVRQTNTEVTTSGKPKKSCTWIEFTTIYKVNITCYDKSVFST